MPTIVNIINWLKSQIRNECGFTYAETNCMLVLLLLMSGLLAAPALIGRYSKTCHTSTYTIDTLILNNALSTLQAQKPPKAIPETANNHTNAADNLTPAPKSDGHNIPKAPPLPHQTAQAKKAATYQSFDINTATPENLQTLPGIGEKLATRIIKYKNQLGGYVHKLQYQEVYGIGLIALQHLSLYTYILDDFQPHQLSINQADFKTLLRHPYLSYEQVKKIIQHRERYGAFQQVATLSEKAIIDAYTFKRLRPYLKL